MAGAVQGLSFVSFVDGVLGGGVRYTPAQRTWARVAIDGVDPCRLEGEERELARALFGEVDDVPPLARRVLVDVFGRGSGKDQMGGDYGLWRMLTADVTRAGPGDVPTFVVVAPDLRLAGLTRSRARERARATPEIGRLVESESADGFTLRRPQDGRLVAFEVLPATRAGSSARGRSVLGALLSECAFFRDEASVVNDLAIYSAILPRLMPGGAIVLASTPWAEIGLFHELYTKNRGKPATALVAQASTSVMRPDDPEIAALVELETARDPLNAQRELGAQFIGIGTSAFFDPVLVDNAVDEELALPLAPDPSCGRACAADLGFRLDASALVILQNRADVALVAYLEELAPRVGAPLVPSDVISRFGTAIVRYGASHCYFDGTYIESVKELCWARGIGVYEVPGGAPGKFEMHLAARELLAEKRIKIPAAASRLIHQLKSIVAKPKAGGGMSIATPRRAGQFHGDLASAFVAAAWAVRSSNAGEYERRALRESAKQAEALGDALFGGGINSATSEARLVDEDNYRRALWLAGRERRSAEEAARAQAEEGERASAEERAAAEAERARVAAQNQVLHERVLARIANDGGLK